MSRFSKKDFESGEGMLTQVWGPALWHVLHTISFNYPVNPTQKQKKEYKRFLLALEKVLPCRYCRENFKGNCKEAGLCDEIFKNRNSFSRFIYKLHCKVNKYLSKKSDTKCNSYAKVRSRYENFRARCARRSPTKSSRKRKKSSKKESGCVDPLKGRKLKCVLDVVPKTSRRRSFALCK